MPDQNPDSSSNNPYRTDVYQQLCSSYHQIDDFRAKLLALLPFASAAGLFLLLNDKLPNRSAIEAAGPFFVPIGIFGAVVTLGLFFYEIYGIRKCGALIDTGIELEKKMKVPGQFMSRPNCLINEPLAAGVIYPAVLAGWLFLALVAWSAKAALSIAGLIFLVGFVFMLAWDVSMVRKARERWQATCGMWPDSLFGGTRLDSQAREERMRVREIMTENPTCCAPDDTVQTAARAMADADCGCLPVVDDMGSRHVVGVVTDRDLAIRALADGLGPETRVREVMTADPACCGPDADVREVERIMADRQVRRVPIVDDRHCCVGMVAQADLARDERDFDDHEVRETIERISEPSSRMR